MRIKDRPEYRSKPVPFSLSANDPVQTAVKIMSEKNIGSVVIVDDDMQVKGIVTERDLMRRLLNKSLDGQTTRLASIMTSEVRTGLADDDVIDWLRQMSNERFRHLPVVDGQGRLVNIMSQGDFVSFTWPDLLGLFKEKTRDTLKGSASQIPLLVAASSSMRCWSWQSSNCFDSRSCARSAVTPKLLTRKLGAPQPTRQASPA